MAYGNWGGNVFRNGERMRDWEDATPYQETDLDPGYWQAFCREEGTRPHHAVLGQQRMRFCGYKSHPVLFVDGNEVDLAAYAIEKDSYGDAVMGAGEIDGYAFQWDVEDFPSKVNLYLTESDGTKWEGFSGYCMGAGHDED